jgi:hypothetical protein
MFPCNTKVSLLSCVFTTHSVFLCMSSTHRHLLLDFFWQVISGPPCITELEAAFVNHFDEALNSAQVGQF